jgi:undecaprenyl diphosphate synthase
MKLLDKWLKKELDSYIENEVKFETIGDISKLSKTLQNRINKTKEKTKNFTKLTQILALNYGSQDEIVRASNRVLNKNLPLTKENIQKNLDTSLCGAKDVDLLIRTSGEIRLSNFLLWQCAYAEMFFTPTLWPDFDEQELNKIIKQFKKRDRKFGGI